MEDRVVQSEAELKWVSIAQGLLRVALGLFIGADGLLGDLRALI